MNRELIATEEIRVPWPGPRPYDEKDWEDFCGRDSELSELIDRVRVNKLTVLLGASGTGKTSLIRAGLVPLLRQERYHPEGDQSAWPVLLLRRWGNVGSSALEENLLLQLEWAIDAIQDWGDRLGQEGASLDAQNLRKDLEAARLAVTSKTDVLEVIEALARKQARRSSEGQGDSVEATSRGGLILIFDQFEEQLRAGLQTRLSALELIGGLVRSKAPTRILVSMRREYQYALRPLELIVGGLSGRSYFLEAMKELTVVDVVKESSEKSNIPIEKDVAERIVGWLGPSGQEVAGQDPPSASEALEVKDTLQDEGGRPDLLQLQAVLLELSRYAQALDQSRVNMKVFNDFAAQFEESVDSGGLTSHQKRGSRQTEQGKENALAQRVLGGALERWIESALRTEVVEDVKEALGKSALRAKSRSHAQWAEMQPEELRLQVRRIAVRLAPRLSSGDYKVSQEENTLFRQALGDEIARLGLKDPELRSQIRVVESSEGPPRLNWEDFSLPEVHNQGQQVVLSGLARVENWSLTKAGDKILICFKEALHRLATANILQYTPFGADKLLYWELVHDQFGPNFAKWAERQRGTWEDCKSSLVVCSGLQIAVPVSEVKPAPGEDFYDLVKVSWQGCGIESSRAERLTLRKVRFRECHLVGTIFDAIDFVDCEFEHCSLKGGLFRGCTFKATRFEHCDANIAIVGGVIEDLEFRNCQLLQSAIEGTALKGEIRYTKGSRVIQGYIDVERPPDSVGARIVFDEESRAALSLWGDKGYGVLRFEDQDLDKRNSPLVDEFKVRQ